MDQNLEKLLEMYETAPVLVAAYDGFDRLRYANAAFRSAYFLDPDEKPFWSDLIAGTSWPAGVPLFVTKISKNGSSLHSRAAGRSDTGLSRLISPMAVGFG